MRTYLGNHDLGLVALHLSRHLPIRWLERLHANGGLHVWCMGADMAYMQDLAHHQHNFYAGFALDMLPVQLLAWQSACGAPARNGKSY